MCSTVSIVNKVVYLIFAKKVKHFHQKCNFVSDRCVNLFVVSCAQCKHMSNHHILDFKYFICKLSFKKSWGK